MQGRHHVGILRVVGSGRGKAWRCCDGVKVVARDSPDCGDDY
jgi:hypothetical protein